MHFTKSSNLDILQKLDSVVKGQELAKKELITMANRSYLRYYQHHVKGIPITECVTNKNVLLVGDSGTGKTFLVDTIARLMNFPVVKLSATDLNPTGAIGGTSMQGLKKIIVSNAAELVKTDDKYYSTEGTIAQTVVFIDEIDKLALAADSTGNWNKHVQANFLKLFENKDVFSSLSFVFAGAFVGLEESIGKESSSIGFTHSTGKADRDFDLDKAITKYGLLPELVGRIQSIVKFDKLSNEDYRDILDNYILPVKVKELTYYGVHDFEMTAGQKQLCIEKAMRSGQGVRSLVRDIERLMTDYEFSLDPTVQSSTFQGITI